MGDIQSDMSPVTDGGGEDLCYVCSGGRSVTHVPNGGWGRRGGSHPCTQWGVLSDTSQVGYLRGEEDSRHIYSGEVLSDKYP